MTRDSYVIRRRCRGKASEASAAVGACADGGERPRPGDHYDEMALRHHSVTISSR